MAKTLNKDTGLVKEIQKVLLDDKDFLRVLVQENLQKILIAEFDNYVQALPYERTAKRRGYRNGSYARTLKTRVGAIELDVIRDREGNFHTELFRRYQRHEQAFVLSLIEMYLQGVSTRKVRNVVETLCGSSVSKNLVSTLSRELDETTSQWRQRPLEREYAYLIVDARYEDIREGGMVISRAVLMAMGVDYGGDRDILSLDIGDSENELEWAEVFQRLKSRGLKGVRYVVSDHHQGLVNALKREFQGVQWQRCQVHFIRNFLMKCHKKVARKYVHQLKDVFAAPDKEQARERKDRLVQELEAIQPRVAEWVDAEIESCFTVFNLPWQHRKRMRSTNMMERWNQELRRRSRVIRIFPNRASCLRLFGAMCMEQSEQWRAGRKYLDMTLLPTNGSEEWKKLARAV